ncbi:MAG: OmpH family outer membrane protein [Alistipes sp.]|jgi:outer membrane protein|nr:OmpH family outer membrane protein [Alistipes sp.]
MKKLMKLAMVAVLALSATTAFGQKFGRVDLASIVPNMPEYQEAVANLETYGKDLQDQLEQIMVEFNTLYANYEKSAATMTDSVRQLKERELAELQQRYQDFSQIAQQDIQRKETELMTPIYDKANEAVKKVASEGGYTAIFSTAGDQPSSAGLAYFDPATLTDITAEVKKALNIE